MGTSNTSKRILLLTTLFAVLHWMSAQGQTTFTVSNTNDSGVGSLRQAILDAEANAGADVVDLTGITGTITLASGLPNIIEDLTINGAGNTATIIDGASQFRPFFIGGAGLSDTDAPVVIINDLAIQNGLAKGVDATGSAGGGSGMGGAMFINDGTITLNNIIFDGNQANGGNGGNDQFSGGGDGGDGPFANSGGAAASLGYFLGGNGGFGAGGGGGIYYFNYGGADGGKGGYGAGGGGGGGHSSAPGNGGQSGTFGGHGASAVDLASAGGGGGAGLGGAIFVRNGSIDLINCTLNNNSTAGGLGGVVSGVPTGGNGQAKGGAIFNTSGGVYNQNSTFSNNSAANAGSSDSDNVDNYGQFQTNNNSGPVLTFHPLNQAAEVVSNTNITITLDKTGYLSGSPLVNADLISLISLNQGTVDGLVVAITATISNNIITIVPATELNIAETYFLSIGIVEDYFGNVTTAQSVSFSTTSNQPPTFTISHTALTLLEGITTTQQYPAFVTNIDDGDPTLTQNTTLSLEILAGAELFLTQPQFGTNNLIYFRGVGGNVTGAAVVSVTVTDDGPGQASTTKTFTITIEEINDSPEIEGETNFSFGEDVPSQVILPNHFSISSGGNDPNQNITITIDKTNLNEVFTDVALALDGTITIDVDASEFKFHNNNGEASIGVTLEDDGGRENNGNDTYNTTIYLSLNNTIDSPPFFGATVSGSTTITEFESLNYRFSVRDEDSEDFEITNIQKPSWMNLQAYGWNTYTDPVSNQEFAQPEYRLYGYPGADEFVGTNTFSFEINGTEITVDIEVTDEDSEPTGTPVASMTVDEGPGEQRVLMIENLSDGDALMEQTLILDFLQYYMSGVSNATIFKTLPTLDLSTGELVFELMPDFNGGPILFTFEIYDDPIDADEGENYIYGGSIPLTVNPVEDFPEFINSPITSIDEGDEFNFPLNHRDGDGDEVTLDILSIPSWIQETGNRPNSGLTGIPTEAEVGDHSISLRLTDSKGNETLLTETVTVINVQNPPSDVKISPEEIDETIQIGESVTLIAVDTDLNETYNFTLVAGEGDTDNAVFQINGDQLVVQQTFHYESKSEYHIRVKVEDSGGLMSEIQATIEINNVVFDPTDIQISNNSIDENLSDNAKIADLTAADEDTNDTHTFTLVAGTGDADNSSFSISGSELFATESFNFETKSSFTIRLQVEDLANGTFEKQFTITVNDVLDPLDIQIQDITANEDEAFSMEVLAVSEDNLTINYSHQLPSWASFVDKNGQPSGRFVGGVTPGDMDGAGTAAQLANTAGGDFDASDNLYFVSVTNHKVKQATPAGVVTTIAGEGTNASTDGAVLSASFDQPNALSIDNSTGIIYVGDRTSLRKIESGNVTTLSTDGTYTTNTGTAESFSIVQDIIIDNGTLYIADQFRIKKVTPAGVISTLVEIPAYCRGMVLAEDGFIYVLSTGGTSTGSKIEKLDKLTGAKTLIASNFMTADTQDMGIAMLNGILYVVNFYDHKLVRVNMDGTHNVEILGIENGAWHSQVPFGNARGMRTGPDGVLYIFGIYGITKYNPGGYFIEGTPTAADIGDHAAEITASATGVPDATKTINIEVLNTNDAPTGLTIDSNTIDEYLLSGNAVGNFTTTDEDPGDAFTYELIAGAGDTDNASFTIDGNQLVNAEIFNFDTKTNYSVRVESTDSGGEKIEQQFTITVNDVTDTPPQFTSTPVTTATEGTEYEYVIEAVDLLDESITLSDITLPEWLNFINQPEGYVDLIVNEGIIQFQIGADGFYYVNAGDNILKASLDGSTFENLLPAASLTSVQDFVVTANNDIIVNDNNTFKKVSNGVLTTIGALSPDYWDYHPSGHIVYITNSGNELKKMDMNGTISDIASGIFNIGYGMEVSPSGNIIFEGSTTGHDTFVNVLDITGQGTTFNLSTDFYDSNNGSPGIYTIDNFTYDRAEENLYVQYTYADDNGNLHPYNLLRRDASGNEIVIWDAINDGLPTANTPKYGLGYYSIDENNKLVISLIDYTGNTQESPIKRYEDENNKLVGTPTTSDVGTNSVVIQASDAATDVQHTFDIEVGFLNDDPTDANLDPAAIDEQLPAGSLVGTLTSEDPDNVHGDTHSYALIAGVGDDDNADFTITGNQVFSNVLFDKDVKDAYTIRVETTDAGGSTFDRAFDIEIRDVNQLPTSMNLAGATINENEASGTTIGTLTTVDPDAPDTHVYTLVSGTGDDDNSFFMTAGDQLQSAQPLDFEAQSTYSVRIQSDDTRGGTIEETYTITALNVAESPVDIDLSSSTIDENQLSGSVVGTLSGVDPDGTGSITFDLIAGFGDNDLFSILGNSLLSAGEFDFESDNSLEIKIEVSDGIDPPVEKEFTIAVSDVNEAPAMNDATVTVSEHAFGVYTLAAIDPDVDNQLTYGFISDPDELFQMNTTTGEILVRNGKRLDFETKTQHIVEVVATDQDGLSGTATITINVSDVEERNYAYLEIDTEYFEDIIFGDSPFTIEVFSNSDAPVTFESTSENISISGSVVTILGAGEVTIKASQVGNDTHRPDTDEITFSIEKASHFVMFNGPIEDKLTTDDPFVLDLVTTANIPLMVNVVSGPATASNNLITLTGEAGIVELLFSTAPHDDYNYVGTLAGFVVTDVAKQNPVITFDLPEFTYVKDGELVLTASSDTDMPITFDLFDSFGLAALDGDKLTPFSVGTIFILASVPGNDTFNPATMLKTIEIKPVFSVSGNVYNGSFQTYTAGTAVLVNADNGEIDEFELNEFGFNFSQVKDGRYYLGVDPGKTDEESLYSTFYGDVIFWQDAELVTITNDDIYGLDIQMKSKAADDLLNGNGTIAGRIIADEGTGARAVQGRILDGTPIADVSVFLIRTSDDQIMTEVFSDVNGDFKIEGIPEGEYKLQIEVTGAAMDLAGSAISIDAAGTPVVLTAMVGENGISVESSIVASVEEESFPEGVGVYPNPFTDQLNLKINNDWYGDISAKVYSSDGKLLSSRLINKSFSLFDVQLKVGNLPKGLLLLQLVHGEKVANVRIIKN